MCTSFVYQTKGEDLFLSRTMDFGFTLDAKPVALPRGYTFESDVDGERYSGKYALIGAGRNLGKYILADGVNEHGLACASLYLPSEAVYSKNTEADKTNLAPHEFLLWALSFCKDVSELREVLQTIHLVDQKVDLLGITTPLHWIFYDKSGNVAVIEPTDPSFKLTLKENPVGVMTNTPSLEWHFKNLTNYIDITPEQKTSAKFGKFEAHPFSQGGGTLGLPGGYTPPERFVRAAYLKEHIQEANNEQEGVTNVWYVLKSVTIPKGAVIKSDGTPDLTQYTSSMCVSSLTYYFTPYGNQRITGCKLDDDFINHSQTPYEWDVLQTEDILYKER
ncbi:choloylglycine hydrolase family protein [Listeria booriae]|uniref:choloylglycine hydrolase family protein n=1 Tax=Listeria booriae TaxID=1552123 RepID=UPI00162797EC|nr:choloylglycine hydrolase family protein [Listeria booriae]MBC1891754.1 choloylglycine hydrolase family protein [Listeria booriae]